MTDTIDEETTVPEGGITITLSQSSTYAFAADGLFDAYEIAKTKGDTKTMIKISKIWLGMSTLLAPEGTQKQKLGFTPDAIIEENLESNIG